MAIYIMLCLINRMHGKVRNDNKCQQFAFNATHGVPTIRPASFIIAKQTKISAINRVWISFTTAKAAKQGRTYLNNEIREWRLLASWRHGKKTADEFSLASCSLRAVWNWKPFTVLLKSDLNLIPSDVCRCSVCEMKSSDKRPCVDSNRSDDFSHRVRGETKP